MVPVDDDDAMVERVLKLLSDPLLRAQIGAAAKEHVTEKFAMAALGKNLISAYT